MPSFCQDRLGTTIGKALEKRDAFFFLADYRGGVGGPCAHFSPPFSFWCANPLGNGGEFQPNVPAGAKQRISFEPFLYY
jgi:hypothetical protein